MTLYLQNIAVLYAVLGWLPLMFIGGYDWGMGVWCITAYPGMALFSLGQWVHEKWFKKDADISV